MKTFVEALQSDHSDPNTVKKCLSSVHLSEPEKKIIECWSFIADKKFNKVLSNLDSLSGSYHSLVEAQKYLILGIMLNHKNEHAQAISLLAKAYGVIRAHALPKQQVIAIENLFIAYQHEHDEDGMQYCLDEVNEMSVTVLHSAKRRKAA